MHKNALHIRRRAVFGDLGKARRAFVCIEPWYGINDGYEKTADFSQKRGIVALPAGETFRFSWQAEFFENLTE